MSEVEELQQQLAEANERAAVAETKALKAGQGTIAGFEGARLTPLQYRFAVIRGRYPKTRKYSNAWCLKEAGSEAATNCLRKTASLYMDMPTVNEVINRELAKQGEELALEGNAILADVVELKEMCMGRIPVLSAQENEDGELVPSVSYAVNAPAANKSLELLMRHKKMLTDKTELTGKDGADLPLREVHYVAATEDRHVNTADANAE